MKSIALIPLLWLVAFQTLSQVTRQSYHDREKKRLKELYTVKDTIRNVLHGRYISYYINGNVESKGHFTNNETTGVWEFFYETGNLKMRGILRQNTNYGLWEYFYESGQKSMEGHINGKHREGEWKSFYENGQVKEVGDYKLNKRSGLWLNYFEDGVLKGEIEYTDDHGTYTEYFHTGKVLAQGPRVGQKNVGHWRFFADDGTLYSEGEYVNGKKHGEWINYHSTGKTASRGRYENDIPAGTWEYYFDHGGVASTGEFTGGQKAGYWKTLSRDGKTVSETTYNKGIGNYREYFAGGNLRCKGQIVNEKRSGKWEFFAEDGTLEGECDYADGKGTYIGYYKNGNIQTKGSMDGELKTGTWEIYENDGKLSGYYRPFYDDNKLAGEITSLSGRTSAAPSSSTRRRMTYFDERFNEFRGFILSMNPVMTFTGVLPVSVEFYFQERLGHEFEFTGIRKPFFTRDHNVPAGERYERGYAITAKQKLYNLIGSDLWYFGHEIRFTSRGHYINEPISPTSPEIYTISASEQRIEYGPLLGYRLMKRNNGEGLTVDAHISVNIGFRAFDVDENYKTYFSAVKQSPVATTFNFGFNIGHVFAFR